MLQMRMKFADKTVPGFLALDPRSTVRGAPPTKALLLGTDGRFLSPTADVSRFLWYSSRLSL